ncbi:MAG: O-antigen ligase family protein [Corynebacterium glutamicum]|nr:O-antigen ligase family protein [Corynebacterium glutamicum]
MVSLFLVFLLMLAGRFSLGRFSPALSAVDLRWVIVALAFLSVGLWIAVERPPLIVKNLGAGFAWFLIWIVWMVVSIARSPYGVNLWGEAENILLLGLGILCAAVVMSYASADELRFVWWLIFLVALLYFADALIRGPGQSGRYAAFGGGPNVFVRIMVLGALATLILSIVRRRSWTLWFTPLFAFGAILSGSRGGLVAAILIMFLGLIPVIKRLGFRKTFGLLLASIFIVVLVPYLLGADQLNEMYQRLIVLPLIEGDASSRDVLAQRAIELFSQNPLFGAGLGSVAMESSSGERGLHAHNLMLSTAAEAGIVGLVFLVLSLTCFTLPILRSRLISTEALFALGAAIFVFVAALFSGDYYDSRFMWFFLLMFISLMNRSDGLVSSRE